MKNFKFPYTVKYGRKDYDDWYAGRWPSIADWCNSTYGIDKWEWDHVSEYFMFKQESDKVMFILRWK